MRGRLCFQKLKDHCPCTGCFPCSASCAQGKCSLFVFVQDIVQEIGEDSPYQSACGSTPIMAGMDQPRELEEVLAEGEVLAVPPAAEGSATGKSDDSKGKNWFVQVRPNHSIAIFVSCDAVTCLEALIW